MSLKYDIYLDTSVINFLFADDAPEKKSITIDFFDNFIKSGRYNTYISSFVIEEISKTDNDEKRDRLLNVMNSYPIELLDIADGEIERLAMQYTTAGVIPAKKIFDALHVSISTIYQIHFLVSWNYKHLANVNREQRIRQVNIANHYFHDLRIVTPLELIDYDN
jgi:hypothetical protein